MQKQPLDDKYGSMIVIKVNITLYEQFTIKGSPQMETQTDLSLLRILC